MSSQDDIVLVTGASGLLGSHLIQYLSEKGERVRALYNSTEPSAEQKKLHRVEWVQCDLLDVFEVEGVFENITEVYHCAAIVSFNGKDKSRLLHMNVESTANIVNQCLESGIRKLVYASSVGAIGRTAKEGEITEEQQWEESKYNSVYAKSKYYAELEVWRGIGEGLDAVMVNPTVILGEGDWDKTSSALFKTIYKEFPYYTSGVNGWVDVKDVVKAMYSLMQSEISAERFIVCEGNYSYKEMFTMMAEAMNRKPPYRKAGKLASSIVWRLSALKSLITGKPSTITRETAITAQRKVYYNNSKLKTCLPDFQYTPMKSTIDRISEHFLRDKQVKI